MAKRSRKMMLSTGLAILLVALAAAWAQPAPGHAVQRKQVQRKIAKLERRLELSPATGEGSWRESQLVLAAAQLELAKKLLSRSNLRAAEVIAGQAERARDRAEEEEAGQ